MKQTITVTQDDIDHGTRCICDSCPVARALQRQGYPKAHVEDVVWTPDLVKETRFRALPAEAIRFIKNFDNLEPVKPFSFQITRPKGYTP